jgi:hypothetical protein
VCITVTLPRVLDIGVAETVEVCSSLSVVTPWPGEDVERGGRMAVALWHRPGRAVLSSDTGEGFSRDGQCQRGLRCMGLGREQIRSVISV